MDTAEELAELLRVLSNPVRLKILALCLEERSSKEIREILGLSKPLFISHMKKLLNSGLISCKVKRLDGKAVKYYKTVNFEICCSTEILKDILEEIYL